MPGRNLAKPFAIAGFILAEVYMLFTVLGNYGHETQPLPVPPLADAVATPAGTPAAPRCQDDAHLRKRRLFRTLWRAGRHRHWVIGQWLAGRFSPSDAWEAVMCWNNKVHALEATRHPVVAKDGNVCVISGSFTFPSRESPVS